MKYVPGPLFVVVMAVLLLWVMGRFDAAQSVRIAEQEQQDQRAADHARQVGASRRQVLAQSRLADSIVAAKRVQLRRQEARVVAAESEAKQWEDSAAAVIARLDTAQQRPVVSLLDSYRAQIKAYATIADLANEVSDTLQADRDRFKAQLEAEVALGQHWQARAQAWEREAKRGCWPLVGCVSREVVFVAGAAAGAAATLALRPN